MKLAIAFLPLILLSCSHIARSPGSTKSVVCSELKALDGKTTDASAILKDCIQKTPADGVLELPAGKYMLRDQLRIQSPLTLRTQGKSADMPVCNWEGDKSCVELVADPELFVKLGLILDEAPRFKMNHIILNGNKSNRWTKPAGKECAAGTTNHYGFNMTIYGDETVITKSVSKEGLCGTGLQLGKVNKVSITQNVFAKNGIHTAQGLWSDGLTVGEGVDAVITDNEFFNNTDIDLILFSCKGCTVQRNRIRHDTDFQGSAFGGVMIGAAPLGDFTRSVISQNDIDCSKDRRCGFGLYVGTQAWSMKNHQVFGGSVNNNRINNTQQGFNVDRTTGVVEIYDNFVQNSGGKVIKTSCGKKPTSAWNISPESIVDRSKDKTPDSSYTRIQWDDCIPNWWQ